MTVKAQLIDLGVWAGVRVDSQHSLIFLLHPLLLCLSEVLHSQRTVLHHILKYTDARYYCSYGCIYMQTTKSIQTHTQDKLVYFRYRTQAE